MIRLLAVASLVAVSTAAAASSGQPKKVIRASVQAKARAINVRRTDLPGSGWRSSPASRNNSFPNCSFYHPNQSDLTENADAHSPTFSLRSGSSISSSTAIFQTATQGRTAYARVAQPALARCLGQLFRQATGHPSDVTIVSTNAFRVAGFGERAALFQIRALFRSSPRARIRVYLDYILINRAKVDTVIAFAGLGAPFSTPFAKGVAHKVAARMAIAI